MSRSALISAVFGAVAAAVMAVPANALPASPGNLTANTVAGASEQVQSVAYRGYRRNHGGGIRFFLGGRRHGDGWGNYYGRRDHGRRAYRGYGSGYGRGHGDGHRRNY